MVGVERFGIDGEFPAYDPHRKMGRQVMMFHLQCRHCAFEAEGVVTPPDVCPKCFATAWERFTRPGSILENVRDGM